jgi:putative hydrolase of the HAD superfamily
MIQTIILDLGKVIIDFDYRRSVEYLLDRWPVDLADIMAIMGDHALLTSYETGRISSAEFQRTVCGLLGVECSPEEFKQLWGHMFLPVPLVKEELLVALKRQARLWLLSNTSELHFNFLLENFPILRHFDQYILSYQIGAMKPDEKIYRSALQIAGSQPDRVFFSDDRAENVEAALRLGMKAVRFISEDQLRRELVKAGLEL